MTQNNPYVPRFENMLKPLQTKLSKLETKMGLVVSENNLIFDIDLL